MSNSKTIKNIFFLLAIILLAILILFFLEYILNSNSWCHNIQSLFFWYILYGFIFSIGYISYSAMFLALDIKTNKKKKLLPRIFLSSGSSIIFFFLTYYLEGPSKFSSILLNTHLVKGLFWIIIIPQIYGLIYHYFLDSKN